MRKCLLLISLFILIASCGRNKDKERQRAEYVEDSIARAKEERRFREDRERIKPAPEPPKPAKKEQSGSLLGSLPKKWVLLGIYRQQKVVYVPCGAKEPPYFTLTELNSSNPKTFFNYGEDQRTYFIANVKQVKNIYKFDLIRYYEDEGGMPSNYDKLNLDVVNKGKELIIDMKIDQPGVGITRFNMIPESEVKNYMLVKQDPSECEEGPIQ